MIQALLVMPGLMLPWERTNEPDRGHMRIAVLPLTNTSPDPNDACFADGMTEETLWSQAYERKLEDIFSLQKDIARQVTAIVQGELAPASRPPHGPQPTSNMDAYILCMRGRYLWNQRSREDVERAVELFAHAMVLDQHYAAAHAGLADAYAVTANRGYGSRREAIAKARRAAERAIETDRSLGEAHASRAVMLTEEYNFEEAEQKLRLAIKLAPS